MMPNLVEMIFALDVAVLTLLLVGVVWSVGVPSRRLWPPRVEGSWPHRLTWLFFYLVFGLNALLILLDWNAWALKSNLRLVLGVPVALLGALLVGWGITTLGRRNTSGLSDGFVSSGPYAFTRNPQYLGDMLLFVGLSLIANSLYLWITHLLTILVFAVTPLAEEIWLEEQYGEEYLRYKHRTSRFL